MAVAGTVAVAAGEAAAVVAAVAVEMAAVVGSSQECGLS